MALGAVFGHFYWSSDTLRGMIGRNGFEMFKGAMTGDPLAVYSHDRQFPNRQHINVLVLGVDYDYDNRAQIVKTAYGRSDSILVARIDFFNKRIDALTIPRDTAVRIPGRRYISKINAAHAIGGPELAVQTISEEFQIPIDAYVVVNFDGFKKIVDAIGGIDLNVEKRLKYDDNWGRLHVNLHPGYQHLNGEEAMGYVRIRKLDNDFNRSKRQHAFLEAVRTKLKSPGTFMRLPKVVDSLNDMLKKGFITEDQMFALANFARGLPKDSIAIETLPSHEGPSYVTCDDDKAAELIKKMFYPYEYTEVTLDTPDPNYVRASAREARTYRRTRRSRRSAERETSTAPETPSTGSDSDLSVDDSSASESSAPASDTPGETESSGENTRSGDSAANG